MASLKKRGKGVYYAQFYQYGKQCRVSLETDNYQVAKEKLRQIESKQFQGNEVTGPTKTPLSQVVNDYIDHVKAVKTPSSVRSDMWYLRQLFGPICVALKNANDAKDGGAAVRKLSPIRARYLEEITTADISTFITGRLQTGIVPKTANRYREIMNRIFNWSMSQRGIVTRNGRNPAAKVERLKEPGHEIRYLTMALIDEQLAALAHDRQLQTMVAVYIYAGVRREEALWLTRDDVDLQAGTNGMIRIRAKTVHGEFWQPKTKSSRAIPVSSDLRPYLEAYRPRFAKGGWFFPSPEGHHWDPDNFSADLRAANQKARLAWSCLDFRHTFGSQLAMNGESLYKISKLMGNSPEICRTHYAALSPESLIDSVEFRRPDREQGIRKPNLHLLDIAGM